MFPVSDRIPMTRRNLSRSPLCRIFVRRRFYPGLCLFLFLPPFSTGTALRRPYAVLMLPVKAQSFMVTGNVRQGRSTNRPEHYGNFECRQDLHENSRLGNIPVNSRVCRKSHVFAFSVLSHVRFFRHFHKACHIRRICRIVSQTISGDPSCAANMFPLLFGRQETACSSATSVRPVPRPINWRIISALPLWFPVSGPMLRLFHIVLVLGNRVKILKLPLYSIQFLHQITTPEMRTNSSELLYSIQFLHQITTSAGQAGLLVELYSIQFLHQITTCSRLAIANCGLYSIQFLHQITTDRSCGPCARRLYSIQFLHQITTGCC